MTERIERPLPMCSCGKPDTPGTMHRYWGQPCHETEPHTDGAVAEFINSLRQERSRLWAEAEDHKAAQGRLLVKIAAVAGERDEARAELAAWDSAVADERDALLVENQALKRSVAFLSSELHDARHTAEFSPEKVDRAAHAMADHEGNINSYEYYEDWAEVMLRAALGPDGESQ